MFPAALSPSLCRLNAAFFLSKDAPDKPHNKAPDFRLAPVCILSLALSSPGTGPCSYATSIPDFELLTARIFLFKLESLEEVLSPKPSGMS